MRVWAAWVLAAAGMHGAVVSQVWRDSKLSLQLDDGTAEIEWIGSKSFRVARSWGERLPGVPKIIHDPVTASIEGTDGNPRMKTRFLTLDVNHASLNLRVRNGDSEIATVALSRNASGVELRLAPMEKVFGLEGGDTGRLNLHGERLQRGNGFFFTNNGYGVLMRSPALCTFDLSLGTIQAERTQSVEFVFYYGPSPKDILEQHQIVAGHVDAKRGTAALPKKDIDGWPGVAELVRTLNQWSLSGVLYLALDLARADRAPAEVKQRVRDLAAVLPFVNGEAFAPYLTTYLREAFDRGYPVIRPLPLEFSRDSNMDRQTDLFMLGDELLVAPVVSADARRRIELPRGFWTDLRTNIEYRGNQTIEIDAPTGHVPLFARNGSLIPLAALAKMQLHYFPSLGGEFFLWEPAVEGNSQFHAAPAGDYMRVEIETRLQRSYEWVLHHTGVAKEVLEDGRPYERVGHSTELRSGTWWYDEERNDLHILLEAAAGSDHIVNVMF